MAPTRFRSGYQMTFLNATKTGHCPFRNHMQKENKAVYLNNAKEKEKDFLCITKQSFVPCTLAEVEELEQWVGHRLPAAYRNFLLWMGHSGGEFQQGSDCFYGDLKKIQSYAKELLAEDHFPGILPENAFVFFMHQGYQFHFFYLKDEDDPPVFFYGEEEPVRTSFSQIYARFSDFLLTEMEGHIRLREEKMQAEKVLKAYRERRLRKNQPERG